jgi:hypothetical protein
MTSIWTWESLGFGVGVDVVDVDVDADAVAGAADDDAAGDDDDAGPLKVPQLTPTPPVIDCQSKTKACQLYFPKQFHSTGTYLNCPTPSPFRAIARNRVLKEALCHIALIDLFFILVLEAGELHENCAFAVNQT